MIDNMFTFCGNLTFDIYVGMFSCYCIDNTTQLYNNIKVIVQMLNSKQNWNYKQIRKITYLKTNNFISKYD